MSGKSLGTLTLDLIAKTGGFESGMDKAGRIADRKTRQMERDAKRRAAQIDKAFTNMAKGIAAAWASIKFVDAIKGAADYADSLSKLSQRTGDTVEDLSALTYAAKLNDATFQDLDQGLKGLANKMLAAQAGSQEAAGAFNALGVSVSDSNGQLRKTGDVLLDIADKFSGMEDGAGKSAIATRLMEESGRKLIPTLNNGRAGLAKMREEAERLGVIVGDELAAKSVELNDNLTRLDAMSQGLAITLGNTLIPAVNDLGNEFLLGIKYSDGFFDALMKYGLSNPFEEIQTKLTVLKNEFEQIDFRLSNGRGREGDEERLRSLEQEIGYYTELQRLRDGTGTPTLPGVKVSAPPLPPTSPKGPKTATPEASDEAKAYADAMAMLDRAQQAANASAQQLTGTEAELVRLMSDPVFASMPETWRYAVATQAEYALNAEKAAVEQQRLNDLLAATPTAQLEQQRNTMLFLAGAFEQGRISAEQFSEAANTALGNVPEQAKPAESAFLDMTLVANDAANAMAGAFTDFLFDPMDQSIEDMLLNFVKAIAKMIAQAAALQAVKAGMSAMGFAFADGGAFDTTGVQPFASGGVVNSPTFFKFASGGSFKSGVMGEAGPEAILPLKRGSDGKLGVTMNGASGITNNINIVINDGGEKNSSNGDDTAFAKRLGDRVKGVVREELAIQQRPGGVLYKG